MAVTLSADTIFRRILEKGGLGLYIPASQIDDLSQSSLQSALWFRNSNWGGNQFQSWDSLIYRPFAATQADYIRYVESINSTSGTVTPDAFWSDVDESEEVFFVLFGGLHPQWMIDAINRALGKVYFENSEPLSLADDAGFQADSTSAYTSVSANFTKVTTADSPNVFSGIGAGRVANTGSDGHIYQRFSVHPREQVYAGALAKPDTGTARLVLWDNTNGAEIASVTYDGRPWAYLWEVENVPAGCDQIEVRLQGDESNAVIFWNALWFFRTSDLRIQLPTQWDTQHKIPALAAARFGSSVAGQNNVLAAYSLDVTEIPASNYDFLFERPGANPYAVQFHSYHDWYGYRTYESLRGVFSQQGIGGPVYIQGRRPYSDLTSFSLNLSGSTSADLDLLEAATRVELFQDARVAQRLVDPETRLADAYGDYLQVASQFQQSGPARARTRYSMPRAMN